jgi:Holliday junction resolvasome RuvABC endonuclease subunit
MRLLAIDPSLSATGYAIFEYDPPSQGESGYSKLSSCGVFKVSRQAHPLHTTMLLSERIYSYFFKVANLPRFDTLAVEWPQVYRSTKSKGDPNDLLGIAALCGCLATTLGVRHVVAYKPAQWIGQLPKARKVKDSPRASRIFAALSETERELVPDQNDVIDAVGIGLYHLNRLNRKRIYKGATL